MKSKIYVVGMGPGEEEMMTGQAIRVLEESDVIVGYPVYLRLLGARFGEGIPLYPHEAGSGKMQDLL